MQNREAIRQHARQSGVTSRQQRDHGEPSLELLERDDLDACGVEDGGVSKLLTCTGVGQNPGLRRQRVML